MLKEGKRELDLEVVLLEEEEMLEEDLEEEVLVEVMRGSCVVVLKEYGSAVVVVLTGTGVSSTWSKKKIQNYKSDSFTRHSRKCGNIVKKRSNREHFIPVSAELSDKRNFCQTCNKKYR